MEKSYRLQISNKIRKIKIITGTNIGKPLNHYYHNFIPLLLSGFKIV